MRPTALPAFGLRLRRLRRSLGVKQMALADLLAVDQTTVSRWESGVQVPTDGVQRAAFAALQPERPDDDALRRLVERSGDCVHLVDEARHTCLAYSMPRARDWRTSRRAMLGVSLWQFATEEIAAAEDALADAGWWDMHAPPPRRFRTSQRVSDRIRISAGEITWERLYLADGTPVRLVSGRRPAP
ncbi:MAG: helix-turn-helix transcriptional regulator [Pseudomonadota bacterium]